MSAPPAECDFFGAEAIGLGVEIILKSHEALAKAVSTVSDQNVQLHQEVTTLKQVRFKYSGFLCILFQGNIVVSSSLLLFNNYQGFVFSFRVS